ncbi:MAG: nucleotide pyrophosphohydrolase [Candidatus Asgardarchaeia archaeon]
MLFADSNTNLQYIKRIAAEFVKKRNWTKYHNPKDLAISIAIEAGELLELFQWRTVDNINSKIKTNKFYLERVKEELADVMIYCIHLANVLDIDITQAIVSKLAKNEEKYPVNGKLEF